MMISSAEIAKMMKYDIQHPSLDVGHIEVLVHTYMIPHFSAQDLIYNRLHLRTPPRAAGPPRPAPLEDAKITNITAFRACIHTCMCVSIQTQVYGMQV